MKKQGVILGVIASLAAVVAVLAWVCLKGGGKPAAEPPKDNQELVAERMADPVYKAQLDRQNDELKKARHAVAVAIAAYDKARAEGADAATLKPLEDAVRETRAALKRVQTTTQLIIREKLLEQSGK